MNPSLPRETSGDGGIRRDELLLLLENTPCGVLLLNGEGTILAGNNQAENLLQLHLDSSCAFTPSLAPGRNDLDPLFLAIFETLEGASKQFELSPLSVGERQIRVRGSRNSRGMLVVVDDVTHQVRIEEQHLRYEKNLLLAQQLAGVGYYETDIRRGIVNASHQFCNIFGLDTPTFPVEEFKKLIHPEDFKWVMKEYQRCIRDGRNFRADYRCIKKNGETIYVTSDSYFVKDSRGEITHIVGMKQDITRRHRAEQTLRKNERLFHSIFENLDLGLAQIELDGTILRANRKFCEITGYSEESLRLMTIREITYHEDREEDDQALERLKRGEIDSYKLEKRYVHMDGSVRRGGITVSLVRDSEGKPECIIKAVKDITNPGGMQEQTEGGEKTNPERMPGNDQNITRIKTMEEALKKSDRQLEEFAFITAHDMKSSATALDQLLERFDRMGGVNPEKEELFQMIRNSSGRILRTIHALNDFIIFRDTLTLKREKVRFQEIVDQACEILQVTIQRSGARIQTKFQECEWILFPPIHLRNILLSLLENSIKYAGEKRQPEIRIFSRSGERACSLIIEDDGRGLDLELYGARVFNLFHRFHPSVEGISMGLHLLRSIVEGYGGSVEIQSQPGQGSRIEIRFSQESKV